MCRRTILPVLALTLAVCEGTAAQKPTAQPDNSKEIEPKLGKVVQARSLMDLEVAGARGKAFGTSKDLALDLETGDVALVLVKLKATGAKDPGFLAIPPSVLQRKHGKLHIRDDANVSDPQLTTCPSPALNHLSHGSQSRLGRRTAQTLQTTAILGASDQRGRKAESA